MSWQDELEKELQRAKDAEASGNHGRVRVAARRAVGVDANEWLKRRGKSAEGMDTIALLRLIESEDRLPQDIRSAAGRLTARLDEHFRSPSTNPLLDAHVIIAGLTAFIEKD